VSGLKFLASMVAFGVLLGVSLGAVIGAVMLVAMPEKLDWQQRAAIVVCLVGATAFWAVTVAKTGVR
jgi:hypothetical protein